MISSDGSDRYDRYDSDVSGPKKFIYHKKKQQPLQTCRFSGPLSHLARPANDKDATPSVTHISVSCIFNFCIIYCHILSRNSDKYDVYTVYLLNIFRIDI